MLKNQVFLNQVKKIKFFFEIHNHIMLNINESKKITSNSLKTMKCEKTILLKSGSKQKKNAERNDFLVVTIIREFLGLFRIQQTHPE